MLSALGAASTKRRPLFWPASGPLPLAWAQADRFLPVIARSKATGQFASPSRQCPLANADTRHVLACHCEERSDVAIRFSCGSTKRKAILWANLKSATNLPKQQPTCQAFLRGCGLPHLGDTSCASFAPAFPEENPGLKSLRCIAFSGPHRCAPVPILHWFAMTC